MDMPRQYLDASLDCAPRILIFRSHAKQTDRPIAILRRMFRKIIKLAGIPVANRFPGREEADFQSAGKGKEKLDERKGCSFIGNG